MMKQTRRGWCLLVTIIGVLSVRCAPAEIGVTANDVFTLKDGRFYLDGRPFAEMSFNKFDLFWALWSALRPNSGTVPVNAWPKALATQDKALANLHNLGFRTIRIFAHPYGRFGDSWEHDPAWRADFFKALDATLDLCDKHHIKAIFSLGSAGLCDGIAAQESRQDGAAMLGLIANPASHSRQRLYAYLDVIIARYKSRQSVAMWEITNELTNLADIGVRKGVPAPTLTQVAEFFDSVAKHIKVDDPLRLVSTGGSHLREYAWNLFLGHGWRQRDTLAEQRKAFAAYFQKSAVDVIDIHYYAIHTGGYELARDVDGQPVFMTPPRYTHVAHELGKGIILGEYGALPYGFDGPRKNTKTNDNWFVGYNDATAKHWVQRATDSAVNSGVQLVYFWTYQSDRPQDQKSNPVTYSIAYTPELVQIIVDGNRRLKEKLNAH